MPDSAPDPAVGTPDAKAAPADVLPIIDRGHNDRPVPLPPPRPGPEAGVVDTSGPDLPPVVTPPPDAEADVVEETDLPVDQAPPCSDNACGGCLPLPAAPGAACGACGRYACVGKEAVECAELVCAGARPVCVASTCVECAPSTSRCGSPSDIESCDGTGSWSSTAGCTLPTRCHEGSRSAGCLGVALDGPPDLATQPLSPAFPFSWTLPGKLSDAHVCSVLMLDKGGSPQDGTGEEAFYAGENLTWSPLLDPLYYRNQTVSWAVLSVACKNLSAPCLITCGTSRACAASGVLASLPCDGVPVWSATRTLTTTAP
jgi:hypothetical protein